MYFEIDNTPEHIRRARRVEVVQDSPKEENPRLVLAPFTRPPQVVFDNVLIGSSCERILEVYNPSKQPQQITLGRTLPPGLVVHLPEEWMFLEPETCYMISMIWSPTQPTTHRETIRFTNENRGRYDVIVLLNSVMNVKGKGNNSKGFKISPGKVNKKKPTKKSPVGIYKKKAEIIYNTTKLKKTVDIVQTTQYTQHRVVKLSNKENTPKYECLDSQYKCPFDSSVDLNFNTSEIFSNIRRPTSEYALQETYDKSQILRSSDNRDNILKEVKGNVLKPSNKQDVSVTDVFDNLTFTPLKIPSKNENLEKGPKIIISMNCDSDFDDSLDIKNANKENETHSVVCVASSQASKWITVNHHIDSDSHCIETPTLPNKKIPNTSSPKEFNSPNFSINTEFSRISELSFFPQRFSTERKTIPKINNETHEIIDVTNTKLSSDTYTKDSPNTPMENYVRMGLESKNDNMREQGTKFCRQSLFKEFQRQNEMNFNNFLSRPSDGPSHHNHWNNEFKGDLRSPPRSITPPLQSIPEESSQYTDIQGFDKSERQTTFTMNRTFDKSGIWNPTSHSTRQSWSKKAIKAEPELWKMPAPLTKNTKLKSHTKSKESLSGKSRSSGNFNKSINQNISLNQIGNVYSQSFTVDPFLSSTYFYDEKAVENFEKEFKRWLNCILTPPADLESNIEQKIDVGKAWIENRNKEVPAAPTKEQVSSVYHNSHRLESLRRQARALLLSPEISQVFLKLNTQIEKKLISIRTDRNLHLDVGLQKMIMELLLSYNPLWLRIGLEAIYGLVLPLKSNNDIEGLTTFIIQRMFRNPHLKNKHSKSFAPNMLLPAYMEAIKKFTLKKFFMLVFFLDQAKQKKLISHDPCLFCRNAVCKESREIIIRFTRELIAGIGDITKHLRPLGYVVSHKQSYLDEYKYAVHNIAIDIRDGVRLTKVMEIILMKHGLMSQLRTPAISRLQKVHNVQVAINALKEANFTIVGEIQPADIADGHREKTLSLLWQIIHVLRAPLFEKAANVIQIWWRKKYDVIIEKRMEEERIFKTVNNAASVIQLWWRRIKYNRMVETRMREVTIATITIQKYFRMWYHRSRMMKFKSCVIQIENWYKDMKLMREAKRLLNWLRLKRQEIRRNSAVVIQSCVRRWICKTQYKLKLSKIVFLQKIIRGYMERKRYLRRLKCIRYVQQKYKGKLIMKSEMGKLNEYRRSALKIQSYYRMYRQRNNFLRLKKSVRIVEEHFIALRKMREERSYYLKLKLITIRLQALVRSKIVRSNFLRQRSAVIKLQRKYRCRQAMLKVRCQYLQQLKAVVTLQKHIRSYLIMKETRINYLNVRTSSITIQRYFRTYLRAKSCKKYYIDLKTAALALQRRYRNLIVMRRERQSYLQIRYATIVIQQRFRARLMMSECKRTFQMLRMVAVNIQNRFRALIKMREQRSKYLAWKSSCIKIQNAYRAYRLGNQVRQDYLMQKKSAMKIQAWFRAQKKAQIQKQQYKELKQASSIIQKRFRAYVIGRQQKVEYIRMKTATICIQKYYRNYIITKAVRQQYITLKKSTITIQRFYRSYLEMKIQRNTFLKIKMATTKIQHYYRYCKKTKIIRQSYLDMRRATTIVQARFRALRAMRYEKERYLTLRRAALTLQLKYRSLINMRIERQCYLKLRSATVTIQRRWRANMLMKQEQTKYLRIRQASLFMQTFYRLYRKGLKERQNYLLLKKASITLQRRYRARLAMRNERNAYLTLRSAANLLQKRFRARCLMIQERTKFLRILQAVVSIQRIYRAYVIGKQERQKYLKVRTACILIQTRLKEFRQTQKLRSQYLQLRNSVILIQRRVRANSVAQVQRRVEAATKIKVWYASVKRTRHCRAEFLEFKRRVIIIQSVWRMYIIRKKFVVLKEAVRTIQQYYRLHCLVKSYRQQFVNMKTSVIKLQAHVRCFIERRRYVKLRTAVLAIQVAFKLKRTSDILKKKREVAAVCLQKNIRRYLVQSKYCLYRTHVIYIQKFWRGKLVTRLMRFEFLKKKNFVIKLQAHVRGYLLRKQVQQKREMLLQIKKEQRTYWAASKIQALFRGHKVRMASNRTVENLRRRWRDGCLQSTQESIAERNKKIMEVLACMTDIETIIRTFQSLELLTEVFPMMYNSNASSVVRQVYAYMSVTNRSISSIEVLKYAASVLVNLARYRVTGPKIYKRDRITPVLKFMWRFSNSETHLFCILATYLWLFAKYESVKQDLADFLHTPENHKMLMTIRGNITRMKRMTCNRNKFNTPQQCKFVSHTMNQSLRDNLNSSVCINSSNYGMIMPILDPDYGIVRLDKPRYFEDAQQAITCLVNVYNL